MKPNTAKHKDSHEQPFYQADAIILYSHVLLIKQIIAKIWLYYINNIVCVKKITAIFFIKVGKV